MSNIEDDLKAKGFIEGYKQIKNNASIIKSIDRDFFFELVDYLLEEREQDKARIKELENRLRDINTYILINGIDEPLKTATQIKVENQQQYIIQEKINLLKKKLENSIPKPKVKEILDKAEVMDYYTLPNVINDLQELLEEGE